MAAVAGFRKGLSSPRVTASGRVKAYLPSILMCLKLSGEIARDILGKNFVAFGAELIECSVHIDGVPENHEVDDDAECAELIFLPFAVSLPEFRPACHGRRCGRVDGVPLHG